MFTNAQDATRPPETPSAPRFFLQSEELNNRGMNGGWGVVRACVSTQARTNIWNLVTKRCFGWRLLGMSDVWSQNVKHCFVHSKQKPVSTTRLRLTCLGEAEEQLRGVTFVTCEHSQDLQESKAQVNLGVRKCNECIE